VKRAFVDANVILRYLTRDPPEMAEAALRTFTAAQRGKVRLLLAPITVAEVVWVLESFYGYPKAQITQTLTQFLHADGLEVESLDLLTEALALYHEQNLDFADALVATVARRKGPPVVYSFDRDFDRVAGVTRLTPGSHKA